MGTTASSTPCSRKPLQAERIGRATRFFRLALVLWVLGAGLLVHWPAQAQSTNAEVIQLTVERSDEGVFLSASLKFDIPAVVQDALLKGIAVHFLVEADLYRDRWYWTDRKVLSSVRYLRLSYQALSRRWRLQISSQPISNSGQGVAIVQQFDSLEDAVATMQRISRWRVGPSDEVDVQGRHTIDFRFRLDTSQLPRPIQFGVAGQSDWALNATRNQRVVMETLP